MESEIKLWLKKVLKENTNDFSLKILGNSEKGDGYVGDIVFVSLIHINEKRKEYNLVLKCSKRNQALRERAPVKNAFLNEIYFYETLLPAFTKFQVDKNIQDYFNSVPKCYGSFISNDTENIVFENLKKNGYELWDKKNPLTRKHIIMVLEDYAKFHSISIAMRDQKPEEFEEIKNGLKNVFKQFIEATDVERIFHANIDEIHDLVKEEFDENSLKIWKSLKEKVGFIFSDNFDKKSKLKVVLHGDCWCNNFMFKHNKQTETFPLKVAIIDWQISRYSSPIIDLSYFLFSGISKEDIEDMGDILDYYYEKLKQYTEKLGSNLKALYPRREFLNDWKKYCAFGIAMSCLVYKMCVTQKDEVIDLAQAVENGNDFGKAFSYDVKNKIAYKNRAEYVVKYVTENQLI